MPEVYFRIQWPNGDVHDCYSPSTIIEQHLEVGTEYSVSEFVELASRTLGIASERVRAKYGYTCSSALDQLSRIRSTSREFLETAQHGPVKVLAVQRAPFRIDRKKADE
ncbi:MAG TPA: MSMEG_0570 family nitrogen starvation response protein [Polyangiaceae bacterium]|nr:MSMEG_0570 family nitrogen starvation response protein [Polyangiaceae bacterium]